MTAPALLMRFIDDRRAYQPGEALTVEYALGAVDPEEVRAIELSVLWYTEGKGEEDLAVHFFDRLETRNGQRFDADQPGTFSTLLPNSPLSYAGVIVKIYWCVRARIFLCRGKDLLVEEPFTLGAVPAPVLEEPVEENALGEKS